MSLFAHHGILASQQGGVPVIQFNMMEFNGTDRQIDYGTSLGITGDQISVHWIGRTGPDVTTDRAICSDWDTNGFLLYVFNGELYFQIDGTFAKTAVTANTKYDILATYDGADIKIAVNGVNVATQAHTGNIGASGVNFLVGQYQSNDRFDGQYSNLTVYPVALELNAAELYNGGKALQSWERSSKFKNNYAFAGNFNTGIASGRRYVDYSGNNLQPTVSGTPTFTGTLQEYEFNAQLIDGLTGWSTSNFLNTNKFFPDSTTVGSFEFWVNRASAGGRDFLMWEETTTAGNTRFSAEFKADNTLTVGYRETPAGNFVTMGTTVSTFGAGYYHIFVTFDLPNRTAQFYVNGNLELNSAIPDGDWTGAGIAAGSDNSFIGVSSITKANPFDGSINKARFYTEYFDGQEFADSLYNNFVEKTFSGLAQKFKDNCYKSYDLTQGLTDEAGSDDATITGTLTNTGFKSNNDDTQGYIIYDVNSANLNGSTHKFNGGDVLPIGTDDYSLFIWFKTSSAASQYIMSKQGAGSTYWNFNITSGSFGYNHDNDASNRRRYSSDQSIWDDGEWHLVTLFMDRSAGDITLTVDGRIVPHTIDIATGNITGNFVNSSDFNISSREIGAVFFNGELGPAGYLIGDDITMHASDLFNAGTSICYDDLSDLPSGDLQAKLDAFWPLGNWDTASTGQELIDQAGSNNLTNIGSTPFTGTGLEVQCSK